MPDNTVQEIKDRLNVADVLGGYIQLKKTGASFKALCPFHSERTPSLNISPQRQIWHCFGCGEGGDIFAFVMKYENLDFKEVLKLLAQKAGVQLPEYRSRDPKEQEEKELFLRINDFAARLYHQTLLGERGKEAFSYLENRGLSLGTVKKWQIGFAPDDFHFLHHALLKKSINEEQMIRSGVCAKGEKGNVYDRFHGRITFPIFNYFSQVVGFSARVLPKDDDLPAGRQAAQTAKYINSPETLIYNKSQTLFGLNFAKDEIRKKDEMVIVEGQMDCISLHQAGFENVVASSGTAYNERAMGFTAARRLSRNIKLCFDSDSAGQLAMRKAGELLLKLGFRIKVIILKSAKDPDELVKKSPGLWAKAVSGAVWFLDYFIDYAKEKYAGDPVEQKHYLGEQVVPFLGFIQDPLEQDHYINELVKKFGITERAIRGQIKDKTAGLPDSAKAGFARLDRNFLALEKEVLGGLAADSGFREKLKNDFEAEDFENAEIGQLAEALMLGNLGRAAQESVIAKEAMFMIESLQAELDPEALQKRLLKSYCQLKVNSLKKKQKVLQNRIAMAEAMKEKENLRELQVEFARVSQLKMEWERK